MLLLTGLFAVYASRRYSLKVFSHSLCYWVSFWWRVIFFFFFIFCISPYAAVFISGRIVVSSFASLGVVTFVVMGQVKDEWALSPFQIEFEVFDQFKLSQILFLPLQLLFLFLLILLILLLLLSCQGPLSKGGTGLQCFWDLDIFKTQQILFLPAAKKGFAFWDVGGRSRVGGEGPPHSQLSWGHRPYWEAASLTPLLLFSSSSSSFSFSFSSSSSRYYLLPPLTSPSSY